MATVLTNRDKDGKPRSYTVRWRDPGGRQREKTFRVRPGANAADLAKKFATKVENDKNEGNYTDPRLGRTLFASYAEDWMATKTTTKRPNTTALYRSHLNMHILPAFGGKPLAGVRRSDVQAWANERSTLLAPSTLRLVYSILATIFREAVVDGLIARTPCVGIELRRIETEEAAPLTADQVAALSDAIQRRYRAHVVSAAGTGMRQGELLGLTQDRVQWLHRKIRIDRQLIDVGADHRPIFGPPKTDSSKRTIPLPEVVGDALAVHIAEYGTGSDGLILTNRSGRPIVRRHFYDVWKMALLAAGLPENTRFHVLRHTFVSILIQANESPKKIQQWVGHKSITETMDTYGHLYEESEDTARNAIDAALGATTVGAPDASARG
jgi:integrase